MKAILLLGVIGTAHAEPWRLEGAIGMRMGTLRVDGADTGTDVPGYIYVGVRHDRLVLFGEYDLMSLTYPIPEPDQEATRGAVIDVGDGHGLLHRFGAMARWVVGREELDTFVPDVYVEGGAGLECFVWDAGGVWLRPDLALGVGTELFNYSGHSHGGLTLGLRVTLARRDNLFDAAPECGGPCTYATPPTGWDRSFMFDMAVTFGR